MENEIESSSEDDKPPDQNNLINDGGFFIGDEFSVQYGDILLKNKGTEIRSVHNLGIRIVTQIPECRKLWFEFSPFRTIFDTWEFRYAFWKGYKYQRQFVVLTDNGDNVGLLPLWYDKDKSTYFWFGSAWQEECDIFVKEDKYIPFLLDICPKPVHLNAITQRTATSCIGKYSLKMDDPKFILNLDGMTSHQNFLEKLDGKKRYNIRRDQRIIAEQNPEVIFNDFSDLDKLIELSNARFASKGETTDWQEDPRRITAFREVINQGRQSKSYDVRMITVKIGGKYAAVDLVTTYKGTYAPLKCGYNVAEFPGIGNFVNLLEMDDAISLGMKKMDFLEVNYGWKDKWFEAVPLYLYESK